MRSMRVKFTLSARQADGPGKVQQLASIIPVAIRETHIGLNIQPRYTRCIVRSPWHRYPIDMVPQPTL
jgi:hypothetical protein